jgi:hypothetical protein
MSFRRALVWGLALAWLGFMAFLFVPDLANCHNRLVVAQTTYDSPRHSHTVVFRPPRKEVFCNRADSDIGGGTLFKTLLLMAVLGLGVPTVFAAVVAGARFSVKAIRRLRISN